MGKQRRGRKKLHTPVKNVSSKSIIEQFDVDMNTEQPILFQPTENLFAGIDIRLDNLQNFKDGTDDDKRSVKSLKSIISAAAGNKSLAKKEKLKLRRNLLLRKIDTVNQLKKEHQLRKKRQKVSIIGDTNPLYDALPSLKSVQDRPCIREKIDVRIKGKAVEKASTRKKQLISGVKLFKNVMANKDFQQNPLQAISEHVKMVVECEKSTIK